MLGQIWAPGPTRNGTDRISARTGPERFFRTGFCPDQTGLDLSGPVLFGPGSDRTGPEHPWNIWDTTKSCLEVANEQMLALPASTPQVTAGSWLNC